MALNIGTQLGSHEITALLGKGGMGEVYRARDLKLKREVAIKILPEEFSRDADRVNRFQREAELLASLNHPNIAAIHDLAEVNGSRYLVLELVEGETLADRIAGGRIPVEEALTIAKQITEALEAAHERGIIHRDLKPANIKLTADGKVKVLDFGLAKAMESTPTTATLSNSPTLLSGSMAGMIVGTAAYMSPEQAKGRAVDRRTDIFAFGCVLYEMLTGKRTFDGDDVTDILGAVLRIEPDWRALPEDSPPSVQNLLRLCLEKNVKNRRSDATDVRLDIEQILQGLLSPAPQTIEFSVKPPLWKRALPAVVALIVVSVIVGAAMWMVRQKPPLPVSRFAVMLPEGQTFTNIGRAVVAISPDGSQLVYVANQRLYHRSISDFESRPIPGTETWEAVMNPVFSPDGHSLVFWAQSDRTLKKIAVSGGTSLTLCAAATAVYGMSWDEGGIVFGQENGEIQRVSENGGKPEVLLTLEKGERPHAGQVLPGGDAVLYAASTGIDAESPKTKIFVQSIKPGSGRKLIIDGGSEPRYVSTGHIVYVSEGTLFAVPFDLKRLQVVGGAVPVVEGVLAGNLVGTAQFRVSNTGSLVYVPGPTSTGKGVQRTLAILDQRGRLDRLRVTPKPYGFPRVSPNGKQVAASTDGKDANIWIVDLAGDTAPRQLTLGGTNRYPVWSADGKWVAFQSDREGDSSIFWQKADGTGTVERLTRAEPGTTHIPDSWSHDDQLSYTAVKGTEASVWIFSLRDKKATVFAEKPGAFIGRSAFSPDDHWVAYQSTETGSNQIFVQSFPSKGTSTKYPIARGGQPFWSADGRELIYNPAAGQIGIVGVTTKPSFSFTSPMLLPGGVSGLRSVNPATNPRVWDIAPDGKRILGATETEDASNAASQIRIVLNWFRELQERVPVK